MAEFEHSLKAKRKAFQKTGEFYTPEKMARYMRTFLPEEVKEVYDPTCGGGNLLKIFPDEVKKYGQELNAEPLEWCRENIPNFEGYIGDLLEDPNPEWMNKKFDAIIANPPFSVSWNSKTEKGKDNPRFLEDDRFKGPNVLAPKSRADWAFVQHILHYLSDSGKAVVMLFPGTLYRGNAEGKIRKWFIEQNVIETVIDIPNDQFEDTTIATVVLVLSKHKTTTDIKFISYEYGTERVVKIDEVEKADYNLAVSTYVDPPSEEKEPIDVLDLAAELEYIYVKKVLLELQRSHYMLLTFGDDKELKRLKAIINVLYDLLETYTSKIACDPLYVPPVDLKLLFAKQGLDVEKYEAKQTNKIFK